MPPTEYVPPLSGGDLQLSEFGQAVSRAGADFVTVLAGQIVLAIAGIFIMLIIENAWRGDWLRWIFAVSCLPWLVLAGATLIRSFAPALIALAEVFARRDLDGDGVIGEPEPIESPYIAGTLVFRQDFDFFVRAIVAEGKWSQTTWRDRRLPGVGKCNNTYWKGLIELVKAHGALIGHGDRKTGRLLIEDADTFLAGVDYDRPPPLRPDFPPELLEHQFSSV